MGQQKVKFLKRADIVQECTTLLEAFYGEKIHRIQPPVNVDELLEVYLRYSIVPENLITFLGEGILGATSPQDKCVYIESALYEAKDPSRGRFTLAHEIGHIILHVPYIENFDAKHELLDVKFQTLRQPHLNPRIENCTPWSELSAIQHKRSNLNVREMGYSMTSSRREWQANYFASSLLVPPVLLDGILRGIVKTYKDVWNSGIAEHRVESMIYKQLQATFQVSYSVIVYAMEKFSIRDYFLNYA
jgi:Zn-dependent peptidase ImmA (M78 family)